MACPRRLMMIVVGVPVAAILIGVVGLVIWLRDDPLVADRAGEDELRDRLGVVIADLDAIPDPPGMPAGHGASYTGCSVDSGDIFDPAVTKTWGDDSSVEDSPSLVESSVRAARAVVRGLEARGWKTEASSPGEFGEYSLHKERDGTSFVLSVVPEAEYVWASSSADFRRVCKESSVWAVLLE